MPSKQTAAAAADVESEDLFADLEVDSEGGTDQPATVAAAAAGGSKRKPDKTSEDPVAAAAAAGPSKKRKTAAAAAHDVEGRPARPGLEPDGLQPVAAAAEPAKNQQKPSKGAAGAEGADTSAKKGVCGRWGPKTGAGRTVQWDSSPSERANEMKVRPAGLYASFVVVCMGWVFWVGFHVRKTASANHCIKACSCNDGTSAPHRLFHVYAAWQQICLSDTIV